MVNSGPKLLESPKTKKSSEAYGTVYFGLESLTNNAVVISRLNIWALYGYPSQPQVEVASKLWPVW
jgi:hypothetical protein